MKNTKENLIKLLEKKREVNNKLIEICLSEELRQRLITESCSLAEMIFLLEDKEFFTKQWEIFFRSEK